MQQLLHTNILNDWQWKKYADYLLSEVEGCLGQEAARDLQVWLSQLANLPPSANGVGVTVKSACPKVSCGGCRTIADELAG
jgi:hypothetical protein